MKKYLIASVAVISIVSAMFLCQYNKPINKFTRKCESAGQSNCLCKAKALMEVMPEKKFNELVHSKTDKERKIVIASLDYDKFIKLCFLLEVCDD